MTKAGETIILSDGSYSDYNIIDVYKCLKDFDIDEIVVGMISGEEGSIKDKPRSASMVLNVESDAIVALLLSSGHVELISTTEFNLGDFDNYVILKKDYDRAISNIME